MSETMAEVQGVLWDMDGVLVDTGEAHFESWQQALSERNVSISRADFERTFGMNNAGILSLLLGEELTAEEAQAIGDRKEVLFRQLVKGKARPLPGVLDWLARLANLGVRQAVASSAPQENIDVLLTELGMADHFQAIVSGATLPGKPNPDVFLEAARQIEVPPASCVVVEDAIAGVQAARSAGMRCIAVTTTNSADKLSAADIVVSGLNELNEESFLGQ